MDSRNRSPRSSLVNSSQTHKQVTFEWAQSNEISSYARRMRRCIFNCKSFGFLSQCVYLWQHYILMFCILFVFRTVNWTSREEFFCAIPEFRLLWSLKLGQISVTKLATSSLLRVKYIAVFL